MNDIVNSPMAQLAKVYELIEAHLRKAEAVNKPISYEDLLTMADIKAVAKDKQQVQNCLRTFFQRGHLHRFGRARGTTYVWNNESPPFVLGQVAKQRAARLPSQPTVYDNNLDTPTPESERAMLQARRLSQAFQSPDEVEFILRGVQIVVGVNPVTNRLRIVLE